MPVSTVETGESHMFQATHRAGAFALVCALACCGTGCAQDTTAEQPQDDATASAEQTEPATSEPDGEGNADVTYVVAELGADETWTFTVTVEHPDTGWDDYADGWDVVTPDGDVLKATQSDPFTRPLAHPHVDEQPFTRSQSGITIPEGVTVVVVRAHDLVAGYGGREVTVDLLSSSGVDFEVSR
jgi:hypothetical protein